MTVRNAQDRIVTEVSRWEGVEVSPHRFGGKEFRVGKRELGHMHGDQWADIVFPMAVRKGLIADGRTEPHHILPDSGWTTFRISEEGDVAHAIDLFRISYGEARKSLAKTSRASSPYVK
jgi:luciferase-like monooxygenase